MTKARPLIVNTDLMVLGGNMRLKAMKEAGWESAPVIEVDWPEEKQQEFIIKDNTGFGDWDWDTLMDEWDDLPLIDWGLDAVELLEPKKEATEDNYEIPDEIQTDIKPGDRFSIGNHALLCGDATLIESYEKLCNSEDMRFGLVLTDPPYNVDYTGGTKEALKIMNDKKSNAAFLEFLTEFYRSLISFTSPGAAIYTFHADVQGYNFQSAMTSAGWKFSQCLQWLKNSLVMGRKDYQIKHEPIMYGWKPGAAHKWYSDRKQTTILEFQRPTRSKEHPTMKPIDLLGYLIGNSSSPGDIIVDPFSGSGSTMVAAHQLDRKCFAMELDPKYCQVILERMKELDPDIKITKNGKSVKIGQ